jgi:hypothetical protein
MHIRTRKFIGAFLILGVLVVYSLVAMVVAAAVAMDWPEAGRVAFYAAAGLPIVGHRGCRSSWSSSAGWQRPM